MALRSAVGLWLCSLFALTGTASAQPARRASLFVSVMQHDRVKALAASIDSAHAPHTCAPDWDLPAAIKRTLANMGEDVQDWPTAIPPEQCVDVACTGRLRSVVREGFLLGGQISSQGHSPAHLDLWLVDLAARRIMLARQDCIDCERPEVVARHAAAIVQRRNESLAPWLPLSELATCSALADKLAAPPSAEVPQVAERHRQPILLAVYGAGVPERTRQSVAQGTRQYLELLGQPVQDFKAKIHADAPRSSLVPQQQGLRLLDIELQVNDGKTAVSEVLLRLSDAQDTRQTTVQCANLKGCAPASLVQQIRLHVGTLLDRLDTPEQLPPAAAETAICIPPPLCAPEPARYLVASLLPPTPPANPPPPAEDEPKGPAVPLVATAEPGGLLTICPPSHARKLKIAGATVLGIGGALLVAAIVPSVLSSVSSACKHANGTPAQFCSPPPPSPPNLWPVAGIGFGLGAAGVGSGIGLLAASVKERRMEVSQGGTICPH